MDPTVEESGSLILQPLPPVEGSTETTAFIQRTGHRTVKGRIADWLEMRAAEPGITNIEVAKRLGISTRTLNGYIYTANKEGWLKFEDPLDRIEYNLIPRVLDNLDYYLKQQDKQVTLETAKGTIFKIYQESKGVSEAPQTVLALRIEQAPSDGKGEIITGVVVGKPRQMEE